MAKFGTDGIRGLYKKEITHSLAYSFGLALAKIKPSCKIVVGRDNRPGSKELAQCVCSGIMLGGGNAHSVGLCTTPCISYISSNGYDFGVMITASHNPPEYNGIKIFGSDGTKIDYITEKQIEKLLLSGAKPNNTILGTTKYCPRLKNTYINFLKLLLPKTKNKIVIDSANGASKVIAKKVFQKSATFIGQSSGKNINKNCGALHPQNVQQKVIKSGADIGFAFDGDADRIIIATKNGIYDGDNILFALSKYFSVTRKNFAQIATTITSNMGLQKALKKCNITAIQTDVGDKYVIRKMQQENIILGGEKAGHIIAGEFLMTGDGLLAALLVLHAQKFLRVSFDDLLYFEQTKQHEVSYTTTHKNQIIDDAAFKEYLSYQKQKLGTSGRILVRASGTEQKLRIITETNSQYKSEQLANAIINQIKLSEQNYN